MYNGSTKPLGAGHLASVLVQCLSCRIVTSFLLGASCLFVSPKRYKVVHKDFGELLSLTLSTRIGVIPSVWNQYQ